jgi:hypothetical protein
MLLRDVSLVRLGPMAHFALLEAELAGLGKAISLGSSRYMDVAVSDTRSQNWLNRSSAKEVVCYTAFLTAETVAVGELARHGFKLLLRPKS